MWRRAERLLERAAPRSARDERRLPRLPEEPYERKYGMRLGRAVDRIYIDSFLERHGDDIAGDVLEILDSVYTRRFGGSRVRRADVLDASPSATAVTVRGNLETGEGLPREAYDCFICTQTLSLIYDLPSAAAHAHALLKPGGVLLVTVPGISQQADPDQEEFPDYWRFTKRSLHRLLAEAFGEDNVAVSAHGTVVATASFLYGVPADQVDPDLLAPARSRLRDGRLRPRGACALGELALRAVHGEVGEEVAQDRGPHPGRAELLGLVASADAHALVGVGLVVDLVQAQAELVAALELDEVDAGLEAEGRRKRLGEDQMTRCEVKEDAVLERERLGGAVQVDPHVRGVERVAQVHRP